MTTDLTSPTVDRVDGARLHVPLDGGGVIRTLLLAAAAVGVAGVVGVGAMTNDDEASAVPTAAVTARALIVPEEQAFIDAILGRVPVAHVATDPWCVMHRPC